MMRDAIEQFRDAIATAETIPPADVIGDGSCTAATLDDRNGKGDAAYLLHLDGIPAGGFENHRDGLGWEKWRADLGRPLAFAEAEAHRAKVAAMQARARGRRSAPTCRGARRVRRRSGRPRPRRTTRIRTWSARASRRTGYGCTRGRLSFPCAMPPASCTRCNSLATDGTKRYLTGGRVAGCYFSIGKPGERICIAEGYATGASIHEATGCAVAVAFDCGNLRAVAEAIKAKCADATLILCADDDYRTDGNPGITKATEAARCCRRTAGGS